jgi:hypothetical protein
MSQGYTLLNDPLNAQSEAFVPLYSNSGAIINGSAACVAAYPAIQGYPTVVYQDASGNNHFLFDPKTMADVTAWRTGVDNPPATPVTTLELGDFLNLFTATELIGFQTASTTDPEMAVIIWRANTTPGGVIDLTNPVVIEGVDYAASKGYGGFTATRAAQVLAGQAAPAASTTISASTAAPASNASTAASSTGS